MALGPKVVLDVHVTIEQVDGQVRWAIIPAGVALEHGDRAVARAVLGWLGSGLDPDTMTDGMRITRSGLRLTFEDTNG